jgi:hypothetical protein
LVCLRKAEHDLDALRTKTSNITARYSTVATQWKAEKATLQERVGKLEQELTERKSLSTTCSCRQVENKDEKLEKISNLLDVSGNSINSAKSERLEPNLKETSEDKAHALERMRVFNGTTLQVGSNEHPRQACVSESRTRPLSDDIDSRKRQRDEDDLIEEPYAKRRLVFKDQTTQTYEDSVSVEDLGAARDHKPDAEALMREAQAKLDQAIVVDSLLTAFLRMDRFSEQVVEEASHTRGLQKPSMHHGTDTGA